MKWLFIFAHPDDETVGCGGTISRLIDAGHEVTVISATDGAAGEVHPRAQAELQKCGSLGVLRCHEFEHVATHLRLKEFKVLTFEDGQINNHQVWQELCDAVVAMVDSYKPDAVVTFDHTGWYFHLDHIGVSLATTLGLSKAAHQPDLFFHVHFQMKTFTKWHYVFNWQPPLTHRVDVTDLREYKIAGINLHSSQNLDAPKQFILSQQPHYETYQLISANEQGTTALKELNFFEPII